jgi:coenzyme PQQ synthesis protein D (PqqD)
MPSSEKYVMKSASIASRALGEETIVMSVADSTLFNLNPVASVIWEAADGFTPLRHIVEEKVCRQYEVGFDQAYADAEELVAELVQHGILVVADEPISERSEQK